MNKIIFWMVMALFLSSGALASLSISADTTNYESSGAIELTIGGPSQAKVFVEISSAKGFYLPLILDDLSSPSFEVVLDSDTYFVKATSTYNGENLKTTEVIDVSTVTPKNQNQESQENEELVLDEYEHENFEILFEVEEFNGTPIADAIITLDDNKTNKTYETNNSGLITSTLNGGDYTIYVEKDSFITRKKSTLIDKERTFKFILLPLDEYASQNEDDQDEIASDTLTSQKTSTRDRDDVIVTLKDFDATAYSSSYVPILFDVEGSSPRCQVLTKRIESSGYAIAETILSPKKFNEVVLTKLLDGEYDVRIRCILTNEEAVVSQTKRISVINVDEDIKKLQEFQKNSQLVLDKIDTFPSSFKQIFTSDVVLLESAVSSAKELSKKLQSDKDMLLLQTQIKELVSTNTASILKNIEVDSDENIVAYASKDDVKMVIDYLDLSKSSNQLFAEQENFAIKTKYNFVTLTYASGLIKKQTFVSNQIIPLDGDTSFVSFDAYFIVPTFLIERLEQSTDVVTKKYDSGTLVRLLEDSSALIFDGWLTDVTLIKTVVLPDSSLQGNQITGSLVHDTSLSGWKIPLASFFILIILAGLFFNPFYSVLDVFSKDYLKEFVSCVHTCLDYSSSQKHYEVIEQVTKALALYDKIPSSQQDSIKEIFFQLQELFYESTFHLSHQKISSQPVSSWTFEELEVAIKDFYGSYSKLSAQKQQMYLSYFNQMISHSQRLLDEVKR